jgi:hypothetical protein
MSERDDLLERLLSGETNAADPAVQRLFERDPAARAEYEALRALESSLERQRDRTREVIEASQKLPDRVGAQQVLVTLTKLAEQRPAASPAPSATRDLPSAHKRLSPVWFALAAALIAALAWAWWTRSQKTAPEKEILLSTPTGSELVLMSPVGPVKQYLPFQWTSELQPGGWFEAEIYDPEVSLSDPILVSDTLYEPRWVAPSPSGGWPARIVWLVKRIDAHGIPDAQVSAEASLL